MDRRQFVLGITSIAAGFTAFLDEVSDGVQEKRNQAITERQMAVKKPEFLAELWSEEVVLAYKQEIELAAKLVN